MAIVPMRSRELTELAYRIFDSVVTGTAKQKKMWWNEHSTVKTHYRKVARAAANYFQGRMKR